MNKIDFFISYAHDDSVKVNEIVSLLEEAGANCWMAPRDVVGRYARAIVDAITESKIFLLFVSSHAAVSDQVLNEIEMAYNKRRIGENDIKIEPVCLEPIDMDATVNDEIMYYIRRINFIAQSGTSSAREIVKEVIEKNRELVNFINVKERKISTYAPNPEEDARLAAQNNLIRQFDLGVYREVFARYDEPDILDVGCGNGELLLDRLNQCGKRYKMIGVERDPVTAGEAARKHGEGNISFVVDDVEDDRFIDDVSDEMEAMGINQFDVIHISMLLLHLKDSEQVLRKLRRLLKSNGVVLIKDIDDGINFAYPDDEGLFEHVYRICEMDESAGERRNGRQVYHDLYEAGFKDVALKKSGFSTIGLSRGEKQIFWEMYCKFIYDDIRAMHEEYPNDMHIAEECDWYNAHYETIYENFMKDDFVFSLGFQLYVAMK